MVGMYSGFQQRMAGNSWISSSKKNRPQMRAIL
jgi:hypothetical protein